MRTKEDILKSMEEEIPFNLSTNVKPYIVEAMEIYRKESAKDILVNFMKWYKSTIPIGTQKSSAEIVDSYLNNKIRVVITGDTNDVQSGIKEFLRENQDSVILNVPEHWYEALDERGTPIEDNGKKICNCKLPLPTSFWVERFICLRCWGEYYT